MWIIVWRVARLIWMAARGRCARMTASGGFLARVCAGLSGTAGWWRLCFIRVGRVDDGFVD